MTPPLPEATVPVFTPIDNDGQVQLERIGEYARLLSNCGLRSVFVCGTTGEFSSLTLQERQEVLEAWMSAKTAGDVDTVIAHVGSCSLGDSVQLARHAATCGVDAVACIAPWYFPISDADSLLQLLAAVAAACGSTQFLYYHFPSMTSCSCDVVQLMRQGLAKIPNLVGLKFTDGALAQMRECSRLRRSDGSCVQVLLGADELHLAARCAGITQSVAIGYNFIPQIFRSVTEAADAGDLSVARQQQDRLIEFFRTVRTALPHRSFFSVMKSAMAIMTFDLGPARLPLSEMAECDRVVIRHLLSQAGFVKQ